MDTGDAPPWKAAHFVRVEPDTAITVSARPGELATLRNRSKSGTAIEVSAEFLGNEGDREWIIEGLAAVGVECSFFKAEETPR